MNLSKSVKEAIIKHIMQDVPRVNYRQQAEAKFRAVILEAMPAPVREFAQSEHGSRLEAYYTRISRPGSHPSLSVAVRGYKEHHDHIAPEKISEVVALLELAEKQDDDREALNDQLERSFAAIRTRKQAVTAFPEFERYMPEEPQKLANLPIQTGVITSLMQAGWPQKKEEA